MSLPPGPDVLPARCVCLIVLDGWGIAPPGPGNAIALAHTPVFDELLAEYPHTALAASGPSVGLPEGQMGNSEVGHLTLGAGAVVPQPITRINDAVAHGELARNEVLCGALTCARRVHLIGLTSDGGVHSQFEHLRALIELAAQLGTEELILHCITDGRDTSPTAGVRYLETVERWCESAETGRVASVVGRYLAMDRDQRWERTQAAYDLLVHGRAEHHTADAPEAAREAYRRGETDEFITPTLVGREGCIGPSDSVLCLNFRPDRMRQLVRALAEPGFGENAQQLPGWQGRGGAPPVARLATMTPYQDGWPYPTAFPAAHPQDTLAAVISRAGAKQLHVAETEKYAHVTYFFNGGVEPPLAGEGRVLVPSQRDVPTYDLKPQMSAREITDAFLAAFAEDRPVFSVINFANADMVGHTGVIPATVLAVETIDECLGRMVPEVHRRGGVCVITADHGNAEQKLNPDGSPNTAHTTNPVPLILTARGIQLAGKGTLADVAPTVLTLLGIEPPAAMSGHPLFSLARAPS
ncbi:MAG TPA: 2,3-bisphosphoglycerate-independent phosphoglycerate mutase [Solirubrobacteraceae bacterium]|nr:2,3-bisphosphoglycerate-independent phosphoglycerate mutase [Solirubrobacteraceae bacterium]